MDINRWEKNNRGCKLTRGVKVKRHKTNGCKTRAGCKDNSMNSNDHSSWSNICLYRRRAQVKVGLINLCKGLFSLNAHIYYKLKSGT